MLSESYKGKKVLITGNTGFKGSWLTVWLLNLGADVIGLSRDVPTDPSMFDVLQLKSKIKHYQGDVTDLSFVKEVVEKESPDFVFHLAAQAIVSTSYSDPCDTIATNVIGTMNVLEALREYTKPCVAIMITSDKCYDNVEWLWGYRETDALGGKDIYSGSKGAAELVIKSYYHSFFAKAHPVKIAIGRAGNVIGGGDWAKDRIVVDSVLSWSKGKPVEIRSPKATRPWQHVLEPLSGYLWLGASLENNEALNGEAFNFGPKAEQNRTVVELLADLSADWGFNKVEDAIRITGNIPFHEAGLLKLNCDKALFLLRWESNLEYQETIRFISNWYYSYYIDSKDMYELTLSQIKEYETVAQQRGKIWNP
ncbi:MAG: CDP-glucose 4,6-dehydratase [Sphingobacteriaceae bacterium]|nr:CDP-glucose 4,6-dehydratase [Sphingobacteriaceae bacterium]